MVLKVSSTLLQAGLQAVGLMHSHKRHFDILKDVSGTLKPVQTVYMPPGLLEDAKQLALLCMTLTLAFALPHTNLGLLVVAEQGRSS